MALCWHGACLSLGLSLGRRGLLLVFGSFSRERRAFAASDNLLHSSRGNSTASAEGLHGTYQNRVLCCFLCDPLVSSKYFLQKKTINSYFRYKIVKTEESDLDCLEQRVRCVGLLLLCVSFTCFFFLFRSDYQKQHKHIKH